MNYILGIDGGGTKTKAFLFDRSGNLFKSITVGKSNFQAVGGMGIKNVLKKIVNLINIKNFPEIRIIAGFAGAGRKKDKSMIKKIFIELGFNRNKILVISDAEMALEAVGKNGVVLIAGTGSICIGRKNNKIARSGGWGYLLGDEGSGYYIGERAIAQALKYYDGRGTKTLLLKRINGKFKLKNIEQIINRIYSGKLDKNRIAELSNDVLELAKKQDIIARKIIKESSEELAKMILSVTKKLQFKKCKVGLIGGVFKDENSNLLINYIKKYVKNNKIKLINMSNVEPAFIAVKKYINKWC
jgi:N-acetylglucosamine kinase-like BadF-type ATPase